MERNAHPVERQHDVRVQHRGIFAGDLEDAEPQPPARRERVGQITKVGLELAGHEPGFLAARPPMKLDEPVQDASLLLTARDAKARPPAGFEPPDLPPQLVPRRLVQGVDIALEVGR